MYHTADNGKVCKGEIYNYDCAKNVFDKYVRNINNSITVWDVYVAINAQYHDYIRLYSEWFRNKSLKYVKKTNLSINFKHQFQQHLLSI